MHEPLLTPIESLGFQQKGNNADKARLDISARGVWSTFERTFFDVRIFNPKSVSYQSRTMPQLYALHEDEKKSQYMNRVLYTIGERVIRPPCIYHYRRNGT